MSIIKSISSNEPLDLIIKNGEVLQSSGLKRLDIGVKNGKIVALGEVSHSATTVIDAKHLMVMPGGIDSHVHFREPGLTHKEDLQTGSISAIYGGITTVCEMPNTKPATTSYELLVDKLNRAKGRMYCNYGFYIGATKDNLSQLESIVTTKGCAGVKIFMGSSTGDLLLDQDSWIMECLRSVSSAPLVFHAEDEQCLNERKSFIEKGNVASHTTWRDACCAKLAVSRLIEMVKATNRPIHILHVSSLDEIQLLLAHKPYLPITIEITPQHLLLNAPHCYESLGNYAQMNPPLRALAHSQHLMQAIQLGIVDTIGSDHAPHHKDEKNKDYPECPSGMPGVQTLLPLLLNQVNQGSLSLQQVLALVCTNPANRLGLMRKGAIAIGYDADFALIDMKKQQKVDSSWIKTKCGWSPFEGQVLQGIPHQVIVGGHLTLSDQQLISAPKGEPIQQFHHRFSH